MRRMISSYHHLRSAVGPRRARQIAWAELVERVTKTIAGPGAMAVRSPSLDQLTKAMPTVTGTREVLSWAGINECRLMALLEEFEEVVGHLDTAYKSAPLSCPPEWAVETSTSAILYCLVRELRPQRVVETGIANGHSSFVILSAMHANNFGHLASVDVRHDVGHLVSDELASRWTKIILDGQRPGLAVLKERLGDHRPVGIFFHDGDHRFVGQMLDYKLAQSMLMPGGMLISDDINTTAAWVDAHTSGLLGEGGLILIDRRKAVGFARPN